MSKFAVCGFNILQQKVVQGYFIEKLQFYDFTFCDF